MHRVRRAVFILLVVGVVGTFGAMAFSNSTISYNECDHPKPTPTGTPPVSQPTLTPPPSSGPTATPTPGRSPGPDNCFPKSGSTVWGTQTLDFSVTSDGVHQVKEVKLEVKADRDSGAHDAEGPLFDRVYPRCGRADTQFTVPWDTVADTPYNGHYQVVVTVIQYGAACNGTLSPQVASPRTDLRVDNAPLAIAAPRIIATTQSTVSLQWDAAPVPDVIRYQIYRAETNGSKPSTDDFVLEGYSTGTSFRDQQLAPGVYWYAIVVTRRSVVTPTTGISSPLSDSSAPATIKAPPPPAKSSSTSSGGTTQRYIPLSQLVLPPSKSNGLAPVPDAPYSAQLPYGNVPEEGASGAVRGAGGSPESGPADPRGPVLPVAVGAFLVSAALALGRMPY